MAGEQVYEVCLGDMTSLFRIENNLFCACVLGLCAGGARGQLQLQLSVRRAAG